MVVVAAALRRTTCVVRSRRVTMLTFGSREECRKVSTVSCKVSCMQVKIILVADCREANAVISPRLPTALGSDLQLIKR